MPQFSIIVPVYNVQNYLAACVKSVAEQPGPRDWECILVDDGSKDDTGKIADAYAEISPDLIVILGDRYEMLAAASAALIFGIPVAHLYGGEITEGAYDDAIRHAITKLSYLHFTSTEEYRHRVIQMGESPKRK